MHKNRNTEVKKQLKARPLLSTWRGILTAIGGEVRFYPTLSLRPIILLFFIDLKKRSIYLPKVDDRQLFAEDPGLTQSNHLAKKLMGKKKPLRLLSEWL